MTIDTDTSLPGLTSTGRWGFIGEAALPDDPIARDHERRGRRWLMVSYLFCPCHIPLTFALLSATFGGTAIGAAATGSALWLGIALTTIYALVLWRGFRQIRKAKQIEAAGGTIACTSAGCDLVHLGQDATSADTVAAR